MVATPSPASTNSHWSAPRWRFCGSPSALPGASTISAACERALPSATRKPRPDRSVLRCMTLLARRLVARGRRDLQAEHQRIEAPHEARGILELSAFGEQRLVEQ